MSQSPPLPGIIKLQTCTKVTNRENMRGFKHVFDVCTSERTYHLVADSSQEKYDWINTLNATLFTPSRIHKHSAPSPPQHSHPVTSHDPPSQQHPVRYVKKTWCMFTIATAFQYKCLQFWHLLFLNSNCHFTFTFTVHKSILHSLDACHGFSVDVHYSLYVYVQQSSRPGGLQLPNRRYGYRVV